MATDLMTPRYKVIADYPDSILPVGSILTDAYDERRDPTEGGYYFESNAIDERLFCFEYSLEKYPAVFSPIPWWAERDISEMPKFVKNTAGEVGTSRNWKWNEQEKCFLYREGYKNNGLLPATEAEYITFINSKK